MLTITRVHYMIWEKHNYSCPSILTNNVYLLRRAWRRLSWQTAPVHPGSVLGETRRVWPIQIRPSTLRWAGGSLLCPAQQHSTCQRTKKTLKDFTEVKLVWWCIKTVAPDTKTTPFWWRSPGSQHHSWWCVGDSWARCWLLSGSRGSLHRCRAGSSCPPRQVAGHRSPCQSPPALGLQTVRHEVQWI